jgi:nitrilase
MESRSYVASVSGLMRREDIGSGSEWRALAAAAAPEMLADGGSCIAGPDGEWILPPAPPVEELLVATLDFRRVLEERHNFDPAGHYARPDIFQLQVNRTPRKPSCLGDCGIIQRYPSGDEGSTKKCSHCQRRGILRV